jgi:hypothetical protein
MTRRHVWSKVVIMAALVAPAATARAEPVEDLRRELAIVKRQLREMQETIRQQQALMEKLAAEKTPAPPSPSASAPPAAAVAAAAPPPPPAAETPPPPAPAPAWSPAQPITLLGGGRAYMNISFDGLVDAGWSTRPDVTRLERGDHDPLQRGFTLPNEEIFLDGAVDPYFKGVADLVFKLDEHNDTTVELEEAYVTTSALPWNLQAKAGQFFTEFGRLNTQHPHQWDFVDQPLVIGRMFGPEGLRNPGARLSWLAPTPFYSELFLAVQDSQGTSAFSFRNEEPLFGRQPIVRDVRAPSDLVFAPRWAASFDLTDSQTVVAGLSGAFGPNASGPSTRTEIYGTDLYWKWKPPWQSGGFPFLAFQTEALARRYEAGARAATAGPGGAVVRGLPAETLRDWGLYAQMLWGFRPRWVAGLRGDWVSGDRGAFRPDADRADRFRLSPDLTFYPTEFSKIRLQYNFDHAQLTKDDSSVWLQLEFLLGAHAAHKF